MGHNGSSYSVYADESGVGERYLAFGAILLPTRNVPHAEAVLEEFCRRSGFQGREMSWKKCSASKSERYISFIDLFWRLARESPPIDFRSMVLDRHQTPLKAPEFGCPTEEDGFYKFYHSFITRSITNVAKDAGTFQIHIALTTDWYPHRTEVIEKTVAGTIKRHFGRRFEIAEVLRGHPKASRIHQLADVLLGAVTYRFNQRNPESHKYFMLKAIEDRVGRKLNFDFMPRERPFNIWAFSSRGSKRWAPGSRGQV